MTIFVLSCCVVPDGTKSLLEKNIVIFTWRSSSALHPLNTLRFRDLGLPAYGVDTAQPKHLGISAQTKSSQAASKSKKSLRVVLIFFFFFGGPTAA